MKLLQSLCVATFLAMTTSVFAVGCGDDDTTSTGKAISELEITTGITTLPKGDSTKFTAMATYADGSKEDVSSEVTWNTDDAEVATVSEDGTVTAVDEGDCEISAKYMGKTATESFFVTP